jgi:hypothetical protein
MIYMNSTSTNGTSANGTSADNLIDIGGLTVQPVELIGFGVFIIFIFILLSYCCYRVKIWRTEQAIGQRTLGRRL